MGLAAAKPHQAGVLDGADAIEPSMAEASSRMQALQARLSAAQRRAAEAELRRDRLDAERAAFLQDRQRDARHLENTISELTIRAQAYNRALNEAATLVDEMDRRILFFERQMADVHDTLATTCPSVPPRARDICETTEDSLSYDLDLIRKNAVHDEWTGLRSRLRCILAS